MSEADERKWQETAQREPERIIAAILDAVPARIFWKDRNLVYLGCNAPFAHDAGFERPEDVIGKDDHQMGWREQADIYRADDRAVMESGQAKLLIDEPQTTPDGKTIRLLTSKVPLHDSTGKVFGVLGTYLDVTERARLEEQLFFSNLLHTTGMETAPDAIVVVDEHARIISFNRNFITLWSIPENLVAVGAAYEPVLRLMTGLATDDSVFNAGTTRLQERRADKIERHVEAQGRSCDRLACRTTARYASEISRPDMVLSRRDRPGTGRQKDRNPEFAVRSRFEQHGARAVDVRRRRKAHRLQSAPC